MGGSRTVTRGGHADPELYSVFRLSSLQQRSTIVSDKGDKVDKLLNSLQLFFSIAVCFELYDM